ncbi:MAG: Flp pilus assembly complex ATPase component TadA [Dehalococcoidia bacterium]|nr:MAG: Flp pilus assembly complex ATPase component TadA [Dehalococcoidia bacterium]
MAVWDYLQNNKELGMELVKGSFISHEDLVSAEEIADNTKKNLISVLVEHGFIDSDVLDSVVSLKYGIRIVNLSRVEIEPEATALVPEQVARELHILPISIDDEMLTVAINDPDDFRAINNIATLTRKKIEPVIPVGMNLEDAIDRSYTLRNQIEQQANLINGISENPVAEAVKGAGAAAIRHSPVVQAVDMMLRQAVRDRASDIHIEPQEDCVLVRNRIDGVLHEAVRLPIGVHSAVMTRIKVLSNLNIAERRRPQDGQFSAEVGKKKVDFRVATVEGSHGEMAVLRVLDKSMLVMKLSELGMSPAVLQPFENLLAAPFGMILVSGPTGSGKTTTLYAALQQLDAQQRNIMTIEDPIEYGFKGINQIQVNRQANITFAVGLRAIMRLDPDIILVGEIRDKETATTAVQAAITGHLVLSSIHANDAVSALIRLIDMGVEPFLVSSAVVGSLSQRLIRRICTYCGQRAEISPPEAVAYETEMGESKKRFMVGRGCNFCARSGFLGRVGVFELLTVNDSIRKMVAKSTSASELKEEAIRTGMIPMRTDGMQKVKDGVSTPGEILRNVYTIL